MYQSYSNANRRQSQVYPSFPLQHSFYDPESVEKISDATFAIDVTSQKMGKLASILRRPELINFAQSQCSMQPGQRVQSPHQVQVQPAFDDLQSQFGGASVEPQQFARQGNCTINVYPVSETLTERSEQADLANQSLIQAPCGYGQGMSLNELQAESIDGSSMPEHHPNYAVLAQNSDSAAREEVQPEVMDISIDGDILAQNNQITAKVSLSDFSARSEVCAPEPQSVAVTSQMDISAKSEVSEAGPQSEAQPVIEKMTTHMPKPTKVASESQKITQIVPQVVCPPVTTPTASQTSTVVSSPEASPSSRVFTCPHCPKEYNSSRALGGHTSKMHQGMSETYLQKMAVRQARIGHRVALKVAKDFCSRFVKSEYRQQQRSIQTMIRNEILKIRKAEIDAASVEGEIDTMPTAWYQLLFEEICTPSYPKAQNFSRWLQISESI